MPSLESVTSILHCSLLTVKESIAEDVCGMQMPCRVLANQSNLLFGGDRERALMANAVRPDLVKLQVRGSGCSSQGAVESLVT